MTLILNGKTASKVIADTLRANISRMKEKPTLAIIQVGALAESSAYIARKKDIGESIGALVLHIELPESATESEIKTYLIRLNKDEHVHGVLVQLPLPNHLSGKEIIDVIAPEKDVDGLTSANVTARQEGKSSAIIPATARGIIEILRFYQIPIRGKKVAVLGRSALVGTPTADALQREGAEITVCHSKTPNTKDITRASDIIVVAIGKPKLIDASYFRGDKTQVVVDVGITAVTEKGTERLEEEIPRKRLVGDVDFEAVKDRVAAISPVPGGVGPMTVVALFENVVAAYERQLHTA